MCYCYQLHTSRGPGMRRQLIISQHDSLVVPTENIISLSVLSACMAFDARFKN